MRGRDASCSGVVIQARWLAAAAAIADARSRGAKLVVVDPRQIGLAVKADHWLPVRPGTDGALALSIAGIMIEQGWFDADFVREWTNGPFLIATVMASCYVATRLAMQVTVRTSSPGPRARPSCPL